MPATPTYPDGVTTIDRPAVAFDLAALAAEPQLQADLRRHGRSVVYLYFDQLGRCLYVGQTKDLAKRMQGHRREVWWPDAVLVHVQQVAPDQRLLVEYFAILFNDPIYNVDRSAPSPMGVVR